MTPSQPILTKSCLRLDERTNRSRTRFKAILCSISHNWSVREWAEWGTACCIYCSGVPRPPIVLLLGKNDCKIYHKFHECLRAFPKPTASLVREHIAVRTTHTCDRKVSRHMESSKSSLIQRDVLLRVRYTQLNKYHNRETPYIFHEVPKVLCCCLLKLHPHARPAVRTHLLFLLLFSIIQIPPVLSLLSHFDWLAGVIHSILWKITDNTLSQRKPLSIVWLRCRFPSFERKTLMM